MSRPIALSTMYFQHWPDPADLPGFAAAAHELGFDGIELGHVVEADALARLAPGTTSVPAVHHPCPALPGGPAAGSPLAATEEERRAAADAVLASLATAERFGAATVVLHLGRAIGSEADRARRLAFEVASRYRAGQSGSPRYGAAVAALAALLEELDEAHAEPAADALVPLLARARSMGIGLALETGYHPDELPRAAGMRRLLRDLGGDGLAAWLDTGHVGAQANLGLTGFDEWLEAVGDGWAGAHVHDAVGLRDHLVPGTGRLDLAPVLGRLPPGAPLTCEVDWYFDRAEVREGRAFLEAVGA
jgi:sugar phosphate isomerase/epimerase